MLDPTFEIQQNLKPNRRRVGAIMPLFAVLLPVILIFAGFAINLAYMQLVSTELKIATDAASHAGGRAMSLHQTTDAAIAQAELTIQANTVAGRVLSIGVSDGNGTATEDEVQIMFGRSIRGNNGYGMYQFTEVAKADVDNGSQRATSVGVISNLQLPMAFNVMPDKTFSPARRSIATQVDRDIALVLDRSGSMLYFRDDTAMKAMFDTLYNTWETVTETEPDRYKYRYWRRKDGSWQDKGMYFPEDAEGNWETRPEYPETQYFPGQTTTTTRRLISSNERSNAKSTSSLYYQDFSNNVIYQLEKWTNPNHTLGSSYSSSENSQLTNTMAIYCHDWEYSNKAPRYSRWYYLDLGVEAFIDILEITDQEELVSLVTFSSSATLEYGLMDVYDSIRAKVNSINPTGGTAIGDGMLKGLPPIVSGEAARPFAAKTIVVLTDGENGSGTDPEQAVEEIIGQHDVTIHTVTFSPGADQDAMIAVATAGHGRHYHADDGTALVQIFEEIANNLPTILTE